MKLLARMSWVELKLLLREPLTVLFAFALPLTVLFVMGGVFGNDDSSPDVYRGFGSMDYYVPAYVALVTAAVGLISLPTHIATNRELGVLKRYRASGMSAQTVVGSQLVVAFVIATGSALILIAAAMPTYAVVSPDSVSLVLAGFVLVVLEFALLGILLGALIPSARAAQALGVLLWFVFLMVGGAGPPPEVLTGAMGTIGELTPMRFAIYVIQDGWLGLDPMNSWWVVVVISVAALVATVRLFRWE